MVLAGATFIMPLIVVPNSFIFPFIVPKILFLRSMVALMVAVYVLLLFANKQKYKLKRNSVTLWVLLYFVSFGISTFVGEDWYRSFWDNHERMLGLFTLVHYLLFYLVLSSVIREWRQWKVLLRTFIIFGSLVMMIAFYQQFDRTWLLNQGSDRSASTLGNAIYVGGYGFFLMCMGFLLSLKEKVKAWKWAAGVASFLGLVGVIASQTRGTMVGIIFAVATAMVVYFLTAGKTEVKLKKSLLVAAGIAVLAIGLLITFRESSLVRSLPGIGRLSYTTLNEFKEGPRPMAWGIALDGWRERPIFGWGPNNYYYAYNKFYRPEFLRYSWSETWFDNAHNIVMNTLATQGIVGLIIYIALFFSAGYQLIVAYKEGKIDRHFLAILLAFLVGHFMHNVTVFENPTSYLYFFFTLALIHVITSEDKEETGTLKELGWGLKLIVLGTGLLFIFITNYNPMRANMAVLELIRVISTGGPIIEAYDTAISYPTPHIDDVRNDYARSVSPLIVALQQNNRGEEAVILYNHMMAELQKNRELHPGDIRVHLKQSEVSHAMYTATGDPTPLIKAENIIKDALIYSPKRQQVQFMYASVLADRGDIDGAIQVLKQAYENDKKVIETAWRYALFLNQFGNNAAARAVIAEAEANGLSFGAGQPAAVKSSVMSGGQPVVSEPAN